MLLEQKIPAVIQPVLQGIGLELWACQWHQYGGQGVLRIFIDRCDGNPVSLNDCTVASREIGALLDVEDVIKARYQLEVSSPGVERILTALQHFQKYVGDTVKVKLRSAQHGHRQFLARIEKVIHENILLTVENKTLNVTLQDIQRANLHVMSR